MYRTSEWNNWKGIPNYCSQLQAYTIHKPTHAMFVNFNIFIQEHPSAPNIVLDGFPKFFLII